jgi:hypothetical protein
MKTAVKHGISQLVYRGQAAAVVFHMLWQLDDGLHEGKYCTSLCLTTGKECTSLYLQWANYIQACILQQHHAVTFMSFSWM